MKKTVAEDILDGLTEYSKSLEAPQKPAKKFAYVVTHSTVESVKTGSVLLYTRGRGPKHFECVINSATMEMVGTFSMDKVGPCWVIDGKVQFEKPPLPRGEMSERIMAECRDRAAVLAKVPQGEVMT